MITKDFGFNSNPRSMFWRSANNVLRLTFVRKGITSSYDYNNIDKETAYKLFYTKTPKETAQFYNTHIKKKKQKQTILKL